MQIIHLNEATRYIQQEMLAFERGQIIKGLGLAAINRIDHALLAIEALGELIKSLAYAVRSVLAGRFSHFGILHGVSIQSQVIEIASNIIGVAVPEILTQHDFPAYRLKQLTISHYARTFAQLEPTFKDPQKYLQYLGSMLQSELFTHVNFSETREVASQASKLRELLSPEHFEKLIPFQDCLKKEIEKAVSQAAKQVAKSNNWAESTRLQTQFVLTVCRLASYYLILDLLGSKIELPMPDILLPKQAKDLELLQTLIAAYKELSIRDHDTLSRLCTLKSGDIETILRTVCSSPYFPLKDARVFDESLTLQEMDIALPTPRQTPSGNITPEVRKKRLGELKRFLDALESFAIQVLIRQNLWIAQTRLDELLAPTNLNFDQV